MEAIRKQKLEAAVAKAGPLSAPPECFAFRAPGRFATFLHNGSNCSLEFTRSRAREAARDPTEWFGEAGPISSRCPAPSSNTMKGQSP